MGFDVVDGVNPDVGAHIFYVDGIMIVRSLQAVDGAVRHDIFCAVESQIGVDVIGVDGADGGVNAVQL